LLFARAE